MKTAKILGVCLLAVSSLFSCKKDPDNVATPEQLNEGEVITTLKLQFTETEPPYNKTTAAFRDLDGNGNGPIQLDTLRLELNKNYNVEALLLDETKNPIDTISKEVEEEGDEHQFFYIATNADLSFTYSDKDENNVPIGLKTVFNSGGPTIEKNGSLKVILKHQDGVKPMSGDGDANLGDTDIEVVFPVIIK